MEDKKKTYIYRIYTITEYEIEASSRENAENIIFSVDCPDELEWIDKTTLRVKPD